MSAVRFVQLSLGSVHQVGEPIDNVRAVSHIAAAGADHSLLASSLACWSAPAPPVSVRHSRRLPHYQCRESCHDNVHAASIDFPLLCGRVQCHLLLNDTDRALECVHDFRHHFSESCQDVVHVGSLLQESRAVVHLFLSDVPRFSVSTSSAVVSDLLKAFVSFPLTSHVVIYESNDAVSFGREEISEIALPVLAPLSQIGGL